MKFYYIAIFGLLGVFCRYGTGYMVSRFTDSTFPLGTFAINIIGSFLIGIIYVLGVEIAMPSDDLRVGIVVGFLGGYTTFSSYSLETFVLIDQAKYALASAYFILSPCLGLLATLLGAGITRFAFSR